MCIIDRDRLCHSGQEWFSQTQKETQMESLKRYGKNKWVWVIVLALAALVGGGTYSDQVAQAILVILGQG
jgi:hypothetical protein